MPDRRPLDPEDLALLEEGLALAAQVGQRLAGAALTLAVAESCTGGLLTSLLVAHEGASAFLLEAAVTYSNPSKQRVLGVRPQTLAVHGAVSEACAREMADGMRDRSGADLALSVSGIAGPSGGSDDKPVGTVYVGLSTPRGCRVTSLRLDGSRWRVRLLSARAALESLLLALEARA